jgi:hypothetical protein
METAMIGPRRPRTLILAAFAATTFTAWALSALPGNAAKCKVLGDNQCQSDGQACDPPKKGSCVTHHNRAEFSCTCDASSRQLSNPAPSINFNIDIIGGGSRERERDHGLFRGGGDFLR